MSLDHYVCASLCLSVIRCVRYASRFTLHAASDVATALQRAKAFTHFTELYARWVMCVPPANRKQCRPNLRLPLLPRLHLLPHYNRVVLVVLLPAAHAPLPMASSLLLLAAGAAAGLVAADYTPALNGAVRNCVHALVAQASAAAAHEHALPIMASVVIGLVLAVLVLQVRALSRPTRARVCVCVRALKSLRPHVGPHVTPRCAWTLVSAPGSCLCVCVDVQPSPGLVVPTNLKPKLPANAPRRVTTTDLTLPDRAGLIQCYNPATLQFLGEVPVTTPEQVKAVVAEARKAQTVWAKTTFAQRRAVLQSMKATIMALEDDIVRISVMDTGKPRTFTLVPYALCLVLALGACAMCAA